MSSFHELGLKPGALATKLELLRGHALTVADLRRTARKETATALGKSAAAFGFSRMLTSLSCVIIPVPDSSMA